MEKKLYELKIDPEFEMLIPNPDAEEQKWLEESIKKEGCTDSLITWNGTIIDGHNRFKICTRLGIPFSYCEKNDLPDRDAAKAWIIERQLARRNLTKYQKSKLALAYEPILKTQAKKRQGQRNDLCRNSAADSVGETNADNDNIPQKSAESYKENETRNKVAEIAGVSHDTIAKVKKIEDAADDDLKEQLEEGKISINKAYNSLFGEKTPDTVKIIGKKGLHVEGKMPDVQESFPVVLDLLEDVARNYLVSLEHILLQYTSGMVTEENNNEIISMFRGTAQEANIIIKKRIEEVSK